MQTELSYTEIDIASHFNLSFGEFDNNDVHLFEDKGDDVTCVHITSFDDLKESIDNLIRSNINAVTLDHLNTIELCEILNRAIMNNKSIELSVYTYDNFAVAKNNMLNIFPSYSENQSLISHMLYNKFEQINKICHVIFDFYLRVCQFSLFFEEKETINNHLDLRNYLKNHVKIRLIKFS